MRGEVFCVHEVLILTVSSCTPTSDGGEHWLMPVLFVVADVAFSTTVSPAALSGR